jgi:hypothetical protein
MLKDNYSPSFPITLAALEEDEISVLRECLSTLCRGDDGIRQRVRDLLDEAGDLVPHYTAYGDAGAALDLLEKVGTECTTVAHKTGEYKSPCA